MPKSVQRFSIVFLLMLLAAPAMGDGWTKPSTITEVLVSPSASAGSTAHYVYFSGLTATDVTCTDTSQIFLNGVELQTLENLIMAAFLSGKQVSCYLAGCGVGPDAEDQTVPATTRCKIIQ